jgi:hypothetical protein
MPTERELARLLQEERAQDRAGCPSSDDLAAAALRSLAPDRQQTVLDHLGACADCAEELRECLGLQDWAGVAEPSLPAPRERVLLALAATLAAATLGLGIWNASLRRTAADQREPALNVPIVDLAPAGASRGAAPAPVRAPVPSGAARVMLVLATAAPEAHGEYGLEIADADGRRLWRGTGLLRSRHGTFTASVPRELLAGGPRRVRLFAIDAGRESTLESYSLELDPR